MKVRVYKATDEDPSIPFRLLSFDGTAPDLSAGTWAVRVVNTATGALTSTLTTVTGYSALQGTSPNDYNAVLTFSAGDLATIGAGVFRLELQATISGRQRSFLLSDKPTIQVEAVPT